MTIEQEIGLRICWRRMRQVDEDFKDIIGISRHIFIDQLMIFKNYTLLL